MFCERREMMEYISLKKHETFICILKSWLDIWDNYNSLKQIAHFTHSSIGVFMNSIAAMYQSKQEHPKFLVD